MVAKIHLDLESLAADYSAGLNLKGVAAKYGVSITTAYVRLLEAGVKLRPSVRAREEDPRARLMRSFTIDDKTGCWNCQFHAKPRGYPAIGVYGRTMGAHRFSYEVHKGRIPKGAHVLHSCDNPRCINPDHLSLGTHAQNMREAFARGRQQVGIQRQGAKPVLINGRTFGSLHAAERELGLHRSTITKWIQRGKPGFQALTKEEYLNAQ